MDTSKVTLFTTFLSTLTRKSSGWIATLIIVSGATLMLVAFPTPASASLIESFSYSLSTYPITTTSGCAGGQPLCFLNPATALWDASSSYNLQSTQMYYEFNLNTTLASFESTLGSTPIRFQLINYHTGVGFTLVSCYSDYKTITDWLAYGVGYRENTGSHLFQMSGFPQINMSGSACNLTAGDGYALQAEGGTLFEAVAGVDALSAVSGPTMPGPHGWSASKIYNQYDSPYTPPVADTSTHIASTTPANLQNTATSTSYFFGVEGEINASDIGSNMNVTMQYYNDTLAQAVVSPSVVSHYIKFPLTASTTQSFSFSTTTDMSSAPLGRYYLKTTINKDEFSFFGLFSFWSTAIATKVTTFYVSTTTAHIYVTGYDAIADTSNPANITAIEAGIQTCDFSWGDLASTTKISGFLTCLVVPDSSSLAITFGQFQQNVLTLAPWGYITRFVSILASTTPVEPPPLTYKFGSSSPAVLQAYTASDPITFQVFDYMGSSSPLLQIKADDGSNKNVWDIIDPFVTFLVTIGVLLVVLGDIMGFSMPSGESENERMKKIDYSKMSDKEFQKKVKIEYVTEEEQRMQRRNRL